MSDMPGLLRAYLALDKRRRADGLSPIDMARWAQFKGALTEVAVERLGPIGNEMQRLTADPGHVDQVLRDGAERAAAIADPIIKEVYDIVGFLSVR